MKGFGPPISIAEDGPNGHIFGSRTTPIEDDIGLVEIVHTLGARFMQAQLQQPIAPGDRLL